jgi:predicted hydrocarbon binding protein
MKRRPEPATPEHVREWVSARGAKSGYAMDGDVIRFEYVGSAETGQASPESVCLCPTVEAQTAKTMSPTYCWCSVGYVKEMHERVFGRAVNVELLGSVLTGEKRCRFRITLA